MENLKPRLISEAESRGLGIQHGWYGTRVSGTLMTGPCSTHEECLKKISELPEPASEPMSSIHEDVLNQCNDKSSPIYLSSQSFRTAYQMGHKFGSHGPRDS